VPASASKPAIGAPIAWKIFVNTGETVAFAARTPWPRSPSSVVPSPLLKT
jgi:hypothetical protein